MTPAEVEQIIGALTAILGLLKKHVSPEVINAAIEKSRTSGGDTSDVEQVLNG